LTIEHHEELGPQQQPELPKAEEYANVINTLNATKTVIESQFYLSLT
jgi:hypothetical protein